MKFMKGSKVSNILNEINEIEKIPFYLITAFETEMFSKKYFPGLSEIINKPVTKDKLIHIISNLKS